MEELQETARRHVAEGLPRDSERQPHPVIENAPVAIACCDTEARYKFVNGRYGERHGLKPEQVVGKSVLEVMGEQAWATCEPYFRKCLAGKAIEFELEVDLPYRAGERQFVHCYYEPDLKDGKVVGLIAQSPTSLAANVRSNMPTMRLIASATRSTRASRTIRAPASSGEGIQVQSKPTIGRSSA